MSFDLKIPPLLQLLIVGLLMYFSSSYFPEYAYKNKTSLYVLLIPMILGSIILVWSVISFRIQKTTVNPFTPEKSSSLVTNGVYRITRNPMYLGFVLISISIALYLSNYVSWFFSFLYLNEFQIKPEEKVLVKVFGREYDKYLNEVRRWL